MSEENTPKDSPRLNKTEAIWLAVAIAVVGVGFGTGNADAAGAVAIFGFILAFILTVR